MYFLCFQPKTKSLKTNLVNFETFFEKLSLQVKICGVSTCAHAKDCNHINLDTTSYTSIKDNVEGSVRLIFHELVARYGGKATHATATFWRSSRNPLQEESNRNTLIATNTASHSKTRSMVGKTRSPDNKWSKIDGLTFSRTFIPKKCVQNFTKKFCAQKSILYRTNNELRQCWQASVSGRGSSAIPRDTWHGRASCVVFHCCPNAFDE